jgi:hypothetical protein
MLGTMKITLEEGGLERGGGAVKEIEESDILMDRKKKKKDVSL